MDRVNRIILILIMVLFTVLFAEISNLFLWDRLVDEYKSILEYTMRITALNIDRTYFRNGKLPSDFLYKDLWIFDKSGNQLLYGNSDIPDSFFVECMKSREGLVKYNKEYIYMFVSSSGYIFVSPPKKFYVYLDYLQSNQILRTLIFIVGFTMIIILFLAIILPFKRMEKKTEYVYRNPSIESVVSFYEKTLEELRQKEEELKSVYEGKMKEMEKRIIEEENLAAIGRFSAGITHELRNFLSSLKGSIYVLKQSPDREMIEDMEKEIEEMHKKVEEFLFFIKPTILKKEKQDPAIVIRDVANKLGINIEIVRKESFLIDMDPVMFATLCENIMRNSMDYGSNKMTIIMDAGPSSFFMFFRDYGKKITEKEAEKAFIPFYSGKGSSGLGLSIVYRICTSHGWEVKIRPWDKGTEVIIEGGISGNSGS